MAQLRRPSFVRGNVTRRLRDANDGARGITDGGHRQRNVDWMAILRDTHRFEVIDAFAATHAAEDVVFF